MRKVILLIIVCLLALTFNNGGSKRIESLFDKKLIKIGLTQFERVQYVIDLEQMMFEAAKNYPEVTLTSLLADRDVLKQYDHINTFLSKKYDVIIANLVNTDTASEIIRIAGNTPVIFINRLPDTNVFIEGKHAYVGSKEYEAGKMQGEFLAHYFKEKGINEVNYVMFLGTLGLENTSERTRGVKETLQNAGLDIHKVFEDTADWDRAKAMSKMEQFLTTGQKFNCVIANNDEMALGAIDALRSSNMLRDIPVTGIDANEKAREAIKNGLMSMSVFQNASEQAAVTIELAVKAASGEKIEKLHWIPFETVTGNNIDKY